MLPIISTHKKLLLLLVIILVFISVWIFVKYRPAQKELPPTTISTLMSQSSTILTSTTTASTTIMQTIKTYKNTEWGFEFQYPSNWVLKDDESYNPFSKFTRIGAPLEKKYLIYHPSPPFLVNIVSPAFVEQQFFDLRDKAVKISVGGKEGLKYEYKEEEISHITFVLPLGQYKIILGTNKEYEDIFNQILTTFKFLK